jgi:predicted acyltransferase (DUF342 family)
MAQIIKHRRGSIGSVKTTTARNAELIVASGSISDLSGPFVFIGSPTVTDEGVAGAYKAVSKIYQGTNVPTIAAGTYGSTLDGTPFYSTNDQTLYILGNDGGGGHTNMDLTGNLEGRSIDKITLSSLNGSINVTGSAVISQNISASGDISASNLELQGNANIKGNITLGGNINIGNQNTDLVVFAGEISSSILPELSNEFDLGAPTQNWKNLHVSGTAYINQAKISNMEINGVIVFEDLIVSGNTYLGDRTTDSVNITGSLNVSGSQTLTGSLSQLGDYNLVGSQIIENNLTVSGSTFLGNSVTDLVNITGSLNMRDGDINLSGSLVVTDTIKGTGSIYLQPDINDARKVQIYNTAASDVHIKGTTGLTFLGDDTNYVKIDDYEQRISIIGVNGVFVSSSLNVTGSLNVSGSQTLTGSFKLRDQSSNFSIVGNGFGQTSLISPDGAIVMTPGLYGVQINGANPDLTVDGDVTIKGGTLDVTNVATNISLKDNASNALTINQGSDNYLAITTTDNAEKVTIGNTLTSIDNVIEDNVSNAFVVKEGANPYITIDTTDGSEVIKLETAGNVSVTGITTIGNSTQNTTWNDGALIVSGGVGIGKNLYVSGSTTIAGNLIVLGSQTTVDISSSTVNIGDNIIRLNAYAPFQRYAGIEMMDSGSNNVSASLLWDSNNDYFLIASASGETGRVISTTYGSKGSETPLTLNTIPKSTGASAIGDSYLKDDGTSFSYYTDALVVTGSSGQTYIKGKVTLVHSGGTDADSLSSAILFRNSSNELGYVSTTAVTDETTGILSYRTSDGKLVFSSMIDGGVF